MPKTGSISGPVIPFAVCQIQEPRCRLVRSHSNALDLTRIVVLWEDTSSAERCDRTYTGHSAPRIMWMPRKCKSEGPPTRGGQEQAYGLSQISSLWDSRQLLRTAVSFDTQNETSDPSRSAAYWRVEVVEDEGRERLPRSTQQRWG